VETWRCPTCLTVLVDAGAKRCPSCHSRLRRRRGQPIVLGEASRLDLQATLAVDKRNKLRGEHTFAEPFSPPVAAPVDVREPEPAAVVVETDEPEATPEVVAVEPPALEELIVAEIAELDNDPEPEPAEPDSMVDEQVAVADFIAAFTLPERPAAVPAPAPEPEPEPEPEIVLETTTEPEVDLGAALDGDVNSIVDALHRKARGEAAPVAAPPAEAAPVAAPPAELFEPESPVDQDRPARPLRLMASSSGHRRRWSRRDG
jgi:hypothetical protein